jgi:hypothetical protein
VTDAFNKLSSASAHQQIDQASADANGVQGWNFELKSAITFRPTAIGEVLSGSSYTKGAAHPTDYVGTVVIDSRTAHPITLGDLFTEEQVGLDRLSEQTKIIWPKVYGPGGDGPPMLDEPGNRPVPKLRQLDPHRGGDRAALYGRPIRTRPAGDHRAAADGPDVLAPDMTALAQS